MERLPMSIRRTGGPSHPINVDHIEAPVHAFDTNSWEGTGAAAKAAPGCSPLRATAALRHPPSSANDRRPVSHRARILRPPPIPSVKQSSLLAVAAAPRERRGQARPSGRLRPHASWHDFGEGFFLCPPAAVRLEYAREAPLDAEAYGQDRNRIQGHSLKRREKTRATTERSRSTRRVFWLAPGRPRRE